MSVVFCVYDYMYKDMCVECVRDATLPMTLYFTSQMSLVSSNSAKVWYFF